jgi:cardiolipin synthase
VRREVGYVARRLITLELKLYSPVQDFYTNLIEAFGQAQKSITMMYFTFDWGDWALKITEILEAKQAAGVRVRLIVDEIGMLVDAPANIVSNRLLMSRLSAAGIEVVFFRPRHSRTTHFIRLHFKICSIDRVITFIGGSNIGDEYLKMDDLNLRLEGAAGDSIEKLYDRTYARQNS